MFYNYVIIVCVAIFGIKLIFGLTGIRTNESIRRTPGPINATLLMGISIRTYGYKSYGSNSGFHVFGDLDLDLWPMCYFVVIHTGHGVLETSHWNLHAKFHKNPSSINMWYAVDKHAHTCIHTTRRSNFSNLNLYNSPCARAKGAFPPSLPKTHTQPVPRQRWLNLVQQIVNLKIPRLVERQTSIHDVVGGLGGRIFHLYDSACVHA